MSFLDKLEKFQQEPEPIRKSATVVIVAFLMIIIIGLWIVTSSINFGKSSASVSETEMLSQITLLWNYIKDGASTIINSI
ncbi:hypothetical protein HYS99_01515 [Candidatus Giovannonibacteria bacterium]|nr:hypothetical protein [Candidatus Giovannonibacteria bacterium]